MNYNDFFKLIILSLGSSMVHCGLSSEFFLSQDDWTEDETDFA